MKIFFKVGGYDQAFEIENDKIVDATCTCRHGTIYPSNWEAGSTICWHLRSALNLAKKHGDKESKEVASGISAV
jgi:hypothetical protein